MLDHESTKGKDVNYVKVDLVAHLPHSIAKDMPYAVNEGSLCVYFRFSIVLLSLPLLDVLEYEFGLGIELGSGSSGGIPYKVIL